MKIKVYIMHSDKVDYKNEIYKPLLELGLMKDYYLILPLSEKYKNSYVKQLMNDSDIIICDLTNFNFFANLELKIAKKSNKTIYYFIKSDDKKINKYNIDNIYKYNNSIEFSNVVKNILDSLNKKDLILKRDNIYNLGKIEKEH